MRITTARILFRNGFRKRTRHPHIRHVHRILASLAAQCSFAAGLGAVLVLSGCSSAEHPQTSSPASGTSAGNSGVNLNVGDGANGSSAGNGNGNGLTADGCDVKSDDEVCAAQAYEG